MKKVNVAVIGVRGYAGEELFRIFSAHKNAEVVYASARFEPGAPVKRISDIYPRINISAKSEICVNFSPETLKKSSAEVAFLALPHGVSADIAAEIINKAGVKVIDLSADFRIKDIKAYEEWYGVKHSHPELLSGAVYGLPELYRKDIASAKLIANPGCYPTSIILGCAPFLKNNCLSSASIQIDSKSGFSGGGRKFAQDYTAKNSDDTFAYKVAGTHRHIPEIEQELGKLCGKNVLVTFTPQVVPQERGMLSVIYLDLPASSGLKLPDIVSMYRDFYEGEPFVKVLPEGELPHTGSTVNTNCCAIGFGVDNRTNKLIIFSAIDNLVKGASGQAVQNMNIMFGLNEKEGLEN